MEVFAAMIAFLLLDREAGTNLLGCSDEADWIDESA